MPLLRRRDETLAGETQGNTPPLHGLQKDRFSVAALSRVVPKCAPSSKSSVMDGLQLGEDAPYPFARGSG